ncbi:RelA/SpoT family protein [Ruminococcus flavefaciens]|uniref:RelA/SpoT family protein n=1 Tax=Ruminococcus flavefaciens TaxID=1265 RepID=UPI0026EA36A8|nr:bifunctional (p)ppGpp synthetase/guanosine-3',5'-bis(diphosphate) 3'-pyrophosphohydrolase [Ruminococcus flavefaciens]MDD7517657.1 bifunctional (p)ppGpp synthetase/guanosine-3',5'-bis(diphosphate) 3'-pyrophosphohydrolase [Ruminococcus flavefaciens]MDY5692403.1 bifunctional (p)ppGpp synthetase/guanosine-3',5'-bis(diphosphate) 3'-pyrophosphohydrolase [Ruminococcus flavefaciens]
MTDDMNISNLIHHEVEVPIPESALPKDPADFLNDIPDFNDDFTIEKIIQKILTDDKQYDLSKIISAYEFAAKAHDGQMRSSGKPYITHPLAVAYTLLELGMDTDTICAALLHDVVEDTDATLDDLKKRFGQDVALLVDGVTKLSKIPTSTKEEQQAENIRKILLAMSQDIRVMIIKLSDRLHNMRTLKYRPMEKQRSTALETMNIYAPIAHRLGIRAIKEELQDLAFHYLDPYAYTEIENILENKKEEREAFIEIIKSRIAQRFKTEDFSQPPQIDGRVKSIYSIYRKIFINHKNIDEIYDKYAVRIIVTTIAECYNVLGLIHDMFKPLPNRFKDYISTPKNNMYQSLHTTVLGKEGIPFEVQIRTWDMHETAEYGIAAHWKYKEGIQGKDKMEQRLAWVRQVIEAQQTSDDVEEIVRIIKTDLDPEDIVVMTPKGMSVSLPINSTVIDFAYRIHTEIGHKTTGAKVDGRIVPLDYKLQTGQICEIITSKDPEKGPNRAWLNIVQTNEARSKIRSWFKKERRDENIIEGKAQLEREFKRHRINLKEEQYTEFLQDDFKRHNCDTLDDFYASIGYGGILLSKIIPRLKDKYEKLYEKDEEPSVVPLIKPKANGRSSIVLDQIDDMLIKFAQCCNPLPGDDIIGFITRGYGVSVHTTNCTNYKAALARNNPEELDRWVDIQWTDNSDTQLQTSFEVTATDRVGLVYDISAVLLEARVPIVHSASRVLKNGNALFEGTIVISSTEQLKNLFEKLRKIKGVISVERAAI